MCLRVVELVNWVTPNYSGDGFGLIVVVNVCCVVQRTISNILRKSFHTITLVVLGALEYMRCVCGNQLEALFSQQSHAQPKMYVFNL